jgi:hypothetical protein
MQLRYKNYIEEVFQNLYNWKNGHLPVINLN